MRQPVTPSLLHRLVAGSHAEGTTRLAVAAVIEDRDHILLVDTGHHWQPPSDLVLPGETLTDAVHHTTPAVDITITGYLGHHDLLAADDVVRTFVFAAAPHPRRLSHPILPAAHRWAPIDDLPDDLGDDLLQLIYLPAAIANTHSPYPLRRLAAALRAHADGLLAAEAAVDLLISHHLWLRRPDFTDDYIDTASHPACIDWGAAITALDTGMLPCSSSEAHMLRLAASLADGTPIDLRGALTGLDTDNLHLVAQAVLHTGGH